MAGVTGVGMGGAPSAVPGDTSKSGEGEPRATVGESDEGLE